MPLVGLAFLTSQDYAELALAPEQVTQVLSGAARSFGRVEPSSAAHPTSKGSDARPKTGTRIGKIFRMSVARATGLGPTQLNPNHGSLR
jgi:hypothetical protein